MKILFVCDTYYPHINGVYYFVCRVAPLLQQKGHQVAVIAPAASLQFSVRKIDGVDVYGVPSVPVFYYPGFRIPVAIGLRGRIRRIQENFKPDVIHVQDHFLIAKTIVAMNRHSGVPVIGTNHFMPENLTALVRSEKWKKRLANYCWKNFARVFNELQLVTTPTATAAALIQPLLTKAVIPISSGIDLEQFVVTGNQQAIRKKYGIPDKPVLLYVGRIDPEKHLHEVLEAMVQIIRQTDCCCVITGRGMARASLELQASRLGITEHIIFTGFVAEEDLSPLYHLSTCFVIASTAELLSLATLQAMASALPVVAVNAGALPELVKDDVNGYLYNEGDTPSMAASICKVFNDTARQQRLGAKSLAMAAAHDIHRAADSFEQLYQQYSLIKRTFPQASYGLALDRNT